MTYGITFQRLKDKALKSAPIESDKIVLCDSEDSFEVKLATIEDVFSPLDVAIASLRTSQGIQDSAINQAIASLHTSQASQDDGIGANTSAIIVLNRQSGITSGVDIQYSSGTPATRSDGSALRSGDILKRVDLGREFYRDTVVNRWMSESLDSQNISFGLSDLSATSRAVTFFIFDPALYDLYLIRFDTSFYVSSAPLTTANFWTARFSNRLSNLFSNEIKSGDEGATNGFIQRRGSINNALIATAGNPVFNVSLVKSASAPNAGAASICVHYQLALK